MHISKRIYSTSRVILNFIQNGKIITATRKLSFNQQFSAINAGQILKFHFGSNENTVSDIKSSQKPDTFEKIHTQIEQLENKLNRDKELKEMERIIYPEALLHGQQNISKLSKLYDIMIQHLEKQNLQCKHFQQLIKAGDFYHKMQVRRLKALKPYLKAKHHIQAQKLHQNQEVKKMYDELCNKIDKLIEEDINKGQCKQVERYYKEGLGQQKDGNQLQSLYYYYKGICISEYKKIPNKLLHFNLLAHYVFLSELMRPKCPYLSEAEQYNQSIEKYNELEKLGQKWFQEEFASNNEPDKKRQFQQSQIWIHSNKGNILFRAKRYSQAIKCYQKVIDFYKESQQSDERLQIMKIVDHLEKCYECLGMNSKAIDFLEWAHDFVKRQISQNAILMSKYLKPIDQMLISLYEKYTGKKSQKCQRIQKELRQIVQ